RPIPILITSCIGRDVFSATRLKSLYASFDKVIAKGPSVPEFKRVAGFLSIISLVDQSFPTVLTVALTAPLLILRLNPNLGTALFPSQCREEKATVFVAPQW